MKIKTKIQKWGNGLAIRIAGSMREIPHFQEGTPVIVKITEDGLVIKKLLINRLKLPFSEEELLKDFNAETAHANLLAKPIEGEY